MTAAERIAKVAAKYDGADGEGDKLAEAALRRLEYRKRHSGKECSRCGQTKPVAEFAADSRRPDGLAYACRKCEADRQRAIRRVLKKGGPVL